MKNLIALTILSPVAIPLPFESIPVEVAILSAEKKEMINVSNQNK